MTITVIIPVYNAAELIGEALASVMNQTHTLDEIIVVNDGSTDDLTKSLRPFLSSINLINQTNQGQAVARNKAIKMAKSESIAFLDADDFWIENHIELLRNKLALDTELDYVIGKVKNFIDGEGISEQVLNAISEKIILPVLYLELDYLRNHVLTKLAISTNNSG